MTASEGAPGRGTFSVELHAPSPGPATVAAYSPSAADGSRQHEQDVPVHGHTLSCWASTQSPAVV